LGAVLRHPEQIFTLSAPFTLALSLLPATRAMRLPRIGVIALMATGGPILLMKGLAAVFGGILVGAPGLAFLFAHPTQPRDRPAQTTLLPALPAPGGLAGLVAG